MPTELSRATARRIALAAQGFADPRPTGRVDRRHLRRVLDRIGIIQIDSVNVLTRSQELVLFARLGPHPRSLIPDATAAGELFEYWVHEASHVRADMYPLFRWHMNRHHKWSGVRDLEQRRPGFMEAVLERIRVDGPVVAGDLSERVGPKGQWWDWDDGKIALERLFWMGELAATRRSSDFARVYDLPERVLPPAVLAAPPVPEPEARKRLLLLAADHLGVATFEDLTDYHRQKNAPCKPLLAELVEAGDLRPVQVEGWDRIAYLPRQVRTPRRVDGTALLSPFDPVVWRRERALRMFGFHYRIEIYTPAAKRRYGYYVLPVLVGDELVGRLDLKADRAVSTLRVQASWVEPGVPPAAVAEPIAAELARMARWLELDHIHVEPRGDLASALAPTVVHYARQR